MKILLTGATGYIGRRLLPVLAEAGHQLVCLARNPQRLKLAEALQEQVSVIEGDLLKPESLKKIPQDIEAAYYLVHSMSQSSTDFSRLERESARNLIERLRETNCRQIIYLSGMTTEKSPSPHLHSRMEVERILTHSGIGFTTLRAGVIIGSGSASFEIIRDLVEKLPLMVAPKWLNIAHQPIAIRDVLFYLKNVLGNADCRNKSFDIGGKDVLTYKKMLLTVAQERKLKRYIFTVPVLTPRLSSYWLYFVTSTSFSLARSLVESMKHEVVVREKEIQRIIPHRLLTFEEAVKEAFFPTEGNEILSSWKDAWSSGRLSAKYSDFIRVPAFGSLTDRQTVSLEEDAGVVTERIWKIGGENGWYYGDYLWAIRGFLDKLFGGVGLRRGRRHPSELREGDALDFWRVLLADKINNCLLLFAEMKLPGEAWLEFRIENTKSGNVMTQTATFRPRGLLGRLYWYCLLPVHLIIFRKMARRIAGH